MVYLLALPIATPNNPVIMLDTIEFLSVVISGANITDRHISNDAIITSVLSSKLFIPEAPDPRSPEAEEAHSAVSHNRHQPI